jgi:hypothetical protein
VIERPSPQAAKSVERLRKLCSALPEVTERLSHGEPTWFVRGKKSFMNMSDHHHDDRVAFWCAGADGAQEVLVETQPDRYFRPPYVGHRGWIGVYLDVPGVDWNQIADLVVDAYRQVAPAKLVEQLDAAGKSRSPSESRQVRSRSGRGRTKPPSR